MKSFIFCIFTALSTVGALAQSISNQVLLPAAGLATAGSVSYQQTIGEAAVTILTQPSITLTQGFQQPRITSGDDPHYPTDEINAYPNPVTEKVNNKVNVLLPDLKSRSYNVLIYNFAGEVVSWWSSRAYPDQVSPIEMDMGSLSRGVYIIRVMSTDNQINLSFKIEKL